LQHNHQWGNTSINDMDRFNAPKNIATDSMGYIYVTDLGNRRIQKLDSKGNLQGSFHGSVAKNRAILLN
jgi:large repetitive protein